MNSWPLWRRHSDDPSGPSGPRGWLIRPGPSWRPSGPITTSAWPNSTTSWPSCWPARRQGARNQERPGEEAAGAGSVALHRQRPARMPGTRRSEGGSAGVVTKGNQSPYRLRHTGTGGSSCRCATAAPAARRRGAACALVVSGSRHEAGGGRGRRQRLLRRSPLWPLDVVEVNGGRQQRG